MRFMMNFEIPKKDIIEGLLQQLNIFFSVSESEKSCITLASEEVFKRCEINFSKNDNKYYAKDGVAYFNPYHSGQYTIFLYYFSNTIYKAQNNQTILADKLYYLNKIMNSCDLFYAIDLPSVFMLDQPLGTVLGRAVYGSYFKFTQNCTVGNNKNIFPEIGNNVTMTANTMIFGNSKIGDNVTLGVGACIKDENIPDNSLVFGQTPNLIIKQKK